MSYWSLAILITSSHISWHQSLKLPATNELDKFRNLLDNKDKLVKQEAKDGTRNQYQIEIQRLKKRYGKDFKKLLSQARKMPKGSGKSTPVTGAGERKEQKFLDENTGKLWS